MAVPEEEALVEATAAEVVVEVEEKEKERMVTVDPESAGTSGMHHSNAYACISQLHADEIDHMSAIEMRY